MGLEDRTRSILRSIGRRYEDWFLRDKLRRQTELLNVVQNITSEINMDSLLQSIIEHTNQIMNTERSTSFLFDEKTDELWSYVASGLKRNEVRIPSTAGIAGWVFQNKMSLVVNDPYNDPRFYAEVDKKTGFRTRNIICVPLLTREKGCTGVYQAVNKVGSGFTSDDMELFTSLSHSVVIALENARMYEELKRLDKAKERIINHLSHEMKTPLSIIFGSLGRISRKTAEANISGLENTIQMAQRNTGRLLQLQSKIDDILNEKSVAEKAMIINIFEDALGFAEELKYARAEYGQIMDLVKERIESFYRVSEIRPEKVVLSDFLEEIHEDALAKAKGRSLEIATDFAKGIVLNMDRGILFKACSGLLRNAIENTPDEGRVEVGSESKSGGALVYFRDYGTGISPENQKMIFGGFFHTQDTSYYSSKEPYAFNAGGTGSDLLRTKVFAERCGFAIDFESTRCTYIPGDTNMCPGRISDCTNITQRSECLSSGGSIFTLKFPPSLL
jgi:signal transduction histidine kinase